jgi:hypothetical protein
MSKITISISIETLEVVVEIACQMAYYVGLLDVLKKCCLCGDVAVFYLSFML